eukprot:TRINITY_DN4603_c0_g1_i3.p1 TRINITY_DN4603_c0_g1~~TRINITY_DN4603_c0_g1_i3.p1  ORF type:complete len:128 (-),score=28.40 TRINITY_DN4603_c0_g1_i3:20-403(-)
MAKVAKRLQKAWDGLDREKLYTVEEAVKELKARSATKFDETIEVAMNLGVDPRHADQMVRGVVALPHGTGTVSYTHLRAHETVLDLVCRLLLEKKKKTTYKSTHDKEIKDSIKKYNTQAYIVYGALY